MGAIFGRSFSRSNVNSQGLRKAKSSRPIVQIISCHCLGCYLPSKVQKTIVYSENEESPSERPLTITLTALNATSLYSTLIEISTPWFDIEDCILSSRGSQTISSTLAHSRVYPPVLLMSSPSWVRWLLERICKKYKQKISVASYRNRVHATVPKSNPS